MLLLSVIVAAMPMLGVAAILFGKSAASLISLYPLAFLFLFLRKDGGKAERANVKRFLFLIPGCALLALGIYSGRLSLVWIGSYWNILAVCFVHGITFVFPAPILIFAAPPLAAFTSVVAGFSLRVWLTGVVAKLLSFISDATAQGNVILFQNQSYTVDRVCEGMKMAVATFLIGSVLIRNSNGRGKLLLLLISIPLWLFANILRIFILVIGKVPASSASHEILGMATFVCVILFPLIVVSLLFPLIKGTVTEESLVSHGVKRKQYQILTLCATVPLCLAFFLRGHTPEPNLWSKQVNGFSIRQDSTRDDSRIAIYQKEDSSIIIKRGLFAPGTAHDPRICFEAAGFTFFGESEERIGDFRVRSARVEKAGKPARLYWWYSWKDKRSPSDLDWRIARISGEDVTQVNLYGPDDDRLRGEATRLLKDRDPIF